MTIKERKYFNLIILLVFIGSSIGTAGMFSLILLLTPLLSPPYVIITDGYYTETIFISTEITSYDIAGFVLFSLFNGWAISSIVGGVWLGIRFLRKKSKSIIVLASIFFFFTFVIFSYMGIFVTLPFVIYNFILIRRSSV